MNKKIISLIFMLLLTMTSVIAYGGSGGGVSTYIRAKTYNNNLNKIEFNNAQNFEKELNLDTIKSLEYIGIEKSKGSIEIYEIDPSQAKKIYKNNDLEQLYKINVKGKYQYLRLNIKIKKDNRYIYKFYHQNKDNSWEQLFLADKGDYFTIRLYNFSYFALTKELKSMKVVIPEPINVIKEKPVIIIPEPISTEIQTAESIYNEHTVTVVDKKNNSILIIITLLSGLIISGLIVGFLLWRKNERQKQN